MNAVNVTICDPSAKAATQRALERIAGAMQEFLTSLQPDEIKCFAEKLETTSSKPKFSQAENDFAAKLGADQISDEEQKALEFAALKNYFEWRQELLQDSLTAPQVADLLHTTRQTPHDRLKKNSLVAVQDNGAWRFPIWQFDPAGPDGVIAGLPDVLKVLNVPALSKISWLTRPNNALNGLTPKEALKRGQKEDVISEARVVGVI